MTRRPREHDATGIRPAMVCSHAMSAIEGSQEPPTPQGQRRLLSLMRILVIIAFVAVYLFSIYRVMSEAERRSAALVIEPEGADYLLVNASLVEANLVLQEITVRMQFRVAGGIARDEITPVTDLHLILNTVQGAQQFDFPKGKRINPVEATFPCEGNVGLYPFDKYQCDLWYLLTIPERGTNASGSELAQQEFAPGLAVGTSSLKKQSVADLKIALNASVPGLLFRATKSAKSIRGLTGISLDVGRSQQVVFTSLIVMLTTVGLAVGLVAMVLEIGKGKRTASGFQIPMAVSLIFGLPAFRAVQPGAPPVGTLGDYVAFIWAEITAAVCAVVLIWQWLSRPNSQR